MDSLFSRLQSFIIATYIIILTLTLSQIRTVGVPSTWLNVIWHIPIIPSVLSYLRHKMSKTVVVSPASALEPTAFLKDPWFLLTGNICLETKIWSRDVLIVIGEFLFLGSFSRWIWGKYVCISILIYINVCINIHTHAYLYLCVHPGMSKY